MLVNISDQNLVLRIVVRIVEDIIDDDFLFFNFYIKDVFIILLDKLNYIGKFIFNNYFVEVYIEELFNDMW